MSDLLTTPLNLIRTIVGEISSGGAIPFFDPFYNMAVLLCMAAIAAILVAQSKARVRHSATDVRMSFNNLLTRRAPLSTARNAPGSVIDAQVVLLAALHGRLRFLEKPLSQRGVFAVMRIVWCHRSVESLKRNIEIRFLMKPSKAKKLLAIWKSEKRAIKPYSFVDYYYTLGNLQAKVRHWRSAHTPRTEIILFHRRAGVKTERTGGASSLRSATRELRSMGYTPRLKIVKRKAWLVSKKGQPTYALEFVPGLGWTGETEVSPRDRSRIPRHVAYLKRMGATRVARKSILQLIEEELGRKRSRTRRDHVHGRSWFSTRLDLKPRT